MANVYAVTFTVLGLVIAYTSLVVWAALILPTPVGRARARLESRPVACFLAGAGFLLVTLVLFVGFLLVRNAWMALLTDGLQAASDRLEFNRPNNDVVIIAHVTAWPLAAPILIGWILGGAGFAQMFANRARAMMHDDRPLLALILGAASTGFACFMPAVGWFVFLPVVVLMSIGAGLLSFFPLRSSQTPAKMSVRDKPALETGIASS